jgi:hypothetical protein
MGEGKQAFVNVWAALVRTLVSCGVLTGMDPKGASVIARSQNKCGSCLFVCCVRGSCSYSTVVNSFPSVSLLRIIHAV